MARDNFDPAPILSYSTGETHTYPVGDTRVTLTATDAAGNLSTDTLLVTVEERPAPEPCPCEGTTPTVVDSIDIGDPSSEARHRMRGWGPVEPATSGVALGDPEDGSYRMVWEPLHKRRARRNRRTASFLMKVPHCQEAGRLELSVFDGPAGNSFVVYVNGRMKYKYQDSSSSEDWKIHSIDLTGNKRKWIKVRIIATGRARSGFDTYGRLGVEWAKLYGLCAMD
jgi:hypothetical protein